MATKLNAANTPQFLNNAFQRTLAKWNRERLAPGFPDEDWRRGFDRQMQMLRLEGAFLDELRAEVQDDLADVPEQADAFVAWFEALQDKGPGQNHPLFSWLAETATEGQMRWFLTQEAAGEAGFDDLVAMTQVKLPHGPKLELAENYWDEMGRGQYRGIHGLLLTELVETMQIKPDIDTTVWESLALANAMTAMASTRRYAWLSVGALGVVELTAPWRCEYVSAGLKRLGYGQRERLYYDLHAKIDIKHSEGWNNNALKPLVEEDPRRARFIAEGALIRMRCAERCFERYSELLENGAEIY
ncbi:iron-containing redox enzyme family protein [Sphingomonas sp. ID1715]|uniref:iron-containing redox enzyme family protein n=1 Tax=Sphingomonas sp. ID1715 TaxID=1656898 RepID=UPI00148A1103|nr:iron-containing redox enzyme family protein [Sphingomonas sp. ID1715]